MGQGPFSGSLVARSRLTGSFSTSNGDRGTLSLAYDARYTAPSPLSTVAGVYQWTSVRNGGTSRVTVSAGTSSGGFSGTTETGCAFNGNVSVLDNRYNLLNLSVTTGASGCETLGQNTTLNGLAYYTPASGSTPASLTAIAVNARGGYFALYGKIAS